MRYVPELAPFARSACQRQLLDLVKLNQKDKPELAAKFMAMAQMPHYVDSDFPHDVEVSEAIIAATRGFAITDLNGSILKKFDTLAEAEEARSNAKIGFAVNVELPREDF